MKSQSINISYLIIGNISNKAKHSTKFQILINVCPLHSCIFCYLRIYVDSAQLVFRRRSVISLLYVSSSVSLSVSIPPTSSQSVVKPLFAAILRSRAFAGGTATRTIYTCTREIVVKQGFRGPSIVYRLHRDGSSGKEAGKGKTIVNRRLEGSVGVC